MAFPDAIFRATTAVTLNVIKDIPINASFLYVYIVVYVNGIKRITTGCG